MAEMAQRSIITRPPDVVWSALSDFAGISRWAPNVAHSCLTTDQETGVGTVRRVQVGRNALLETVEEWVPGERLSYSIAGLPPVVRSVTNTWELDARGRSTNVTLTTRVDAGPRPPQQLIARVAGRVLARAGQDLLGGLTAHLDTEEAR